MYYFGYCTFLDEQELRAYLPEGRVVATATARNHRVEFRAIGERRDRGYCHLSNLVDAFGDEARGLVVEVDASRLTTAFDGFDTVALTVHGDDGVAYDCFTWVLSDPGAAIRPPDDYWRHVADGMEAQGFPEGYREGIRTTYEAATAGAASEEAVH